MSDSKNLAIGILSTTAVILLVGLILIESRPEPAFASGVGVEGGDYVMGVGRFDDRTEALYVIDAPTNRMVVYAYDFKSGQLLPMDRIDLGELRQTVLGSGSQQPTSGRRRGRN
jgi:hypothetical protein